MCLSIARSLWPFYYLFMHCAHCHRVSSVFAANDQFGAIKHVNELGKKRSDNVRKTRRKNYLKGAKCELRTRIARRRGRGMVTKCRSSYCIECNVLAIATQSQTNTQNTLSLANFGCCQFVNRRRFWQYAQKISILLIYRCHLCSNSSTLCVSHSCSPSSSPYSALSRGWLSDLLLVCSSLLVQFFLCAQFRMFFYYVFFWWAEDENSLRVLQIEYVNVDYYDKHADESAHCSCLSITCKPGTINKAGKTCAFAKVWHTYKNYIYICMNLYV